MEVLADREVQVVLEVAAAAAAALVAQAALMAALGALLVDDPQYRSHPTTSIPNCSRD
jgi:hypothetical protein